MKCFIKRGRKRNGYQYMAKKGYRKKKLLLNNKIKSTTQAKIPGYLQQLNVQFIRFLMVGMVNTIFSYGVYALLLFLGIEYKVANFGALFAGIIFSFKTQGRFVFNNADYKSFFRFTCCMMIIYLLNIFIIGKLISVGFDAYQAGAVALIPVTLVSYFAQKLIVFRQRKILV